MAMESGNRFSIRRRRPKRLYAAVAESLERRMLLSTGVTTYSVKRFYHDAAKAIESDITGDGTHGSAAPAQAGKRTYVLSGNHELLSDMTASPAAEEGDQIKGDGASAQSPASGANLRTSSTASGTDTIGADVIGDGLKLVGGAENPAGAPVVVEYGTPIFKYGSSDGDSVLASVSTHVYDEIYFNRYTPPVVKEYGPLPNGMKFNGISGYGILSGTPEPGSQGDYPIEFKAIEYERYNPTPIDYSTQDFDLVVYGSVPEFTSAPVATFTVNQSNTFTVVANGDPPARINNSPEDRYANTDGLLFVDGPGPGEATFSGAPTSGGTFAIPIEAYNTYSEVVDQNAYQNFKLVVLQSATITSVNTATFEADEAKTFTITTAGYSTPIITVVGELPNGVELQQADGTAALVGTPTIEDVEQEKGDYTFSLIATNNVGQPYTQAFTLTVTGLLITSAPETTFYTNSNSNSFTVTVDDPSATLQLTGNVPANVTLQQITNFGDDDNSNLGGWLLSGTPPANDGGVYHFGIVASNGFDLPYTQSFTLTVDSPPLISSDGAATFTVGTYGSFLVTTDQAYPTPPAIDYAADYMPAGVEFEDEGDGTALISGTPEEGSGAEYELDITASNGVAPDAEQDFALTVDENPQFTSDPLATFQVGKPGTFTFETQGWPLPTIAIPGVVLPQDLVFDDDADGTATISGTPDTGTGGTYIFAPTATNGVLPDGMQTFLLTIDEAPQISSAATTIFQVNKPGSFTVTTTGYPLPSLSENGSLPSGVNFVDQGNGTAILSGTPGMNAFGFFQLAITASNGVQPDADQTFGLNVKGPPTITSGNLAHFSVGQTGSFTVTAVGYPTPTVVVSGHLPAGLKSSASSNGAAVISGVPTKSGSFNVNVSASNTVPPDAIQTLTIQVNQPPTVTAGANHATFKAGQNNSFVFKSTGNPAPNLSEIETLPAGISFTSSGNGTGTFSGVPSAGAGGTYALVVVAENGSSSAGTLAFTLVVDTPPAISSGSGATFTVGTFAMFQVSAGGLPLPSLIESGALPKGVTFKNNGNGMATISGTPHAKTGKVYHLTLTAKNNIAPNATQAFTLTVDESPGFLSSKATFTVGKHGAATISTYGFPAVSSLMLTNAGVLPAGVSFTDNGNGTASLAGIPAAGTAETYVLQLSAANTAGTTNAAFTLTVKA
jgi:hypothetical protein